MKYKILFLSILVVAILVRFYKLGNLPSGLTWDEAAIGYNAYGLITNHRDEWLKRTPIVFQSFGDFKSPLLIYISTVPVLIFGLTPFAVRLPIALAGTGLVVVSFFLAKEILKKKEISFCVMFLVAISPWAIHYSRMGFESMLATFLVSLGVLGWLKGRKQPWWLVIGDISFALFLYAYHSAKIVVPLIAAILLWLHYKEFLKFKKHVIIGSIIAVLVLAPLGYASFFGKANSRALSTTIIGKSDFASLFVSNYLSHLSPSFLLKGADITYRHSTKEMGVLYILEIVLALAALVSILIWKEYRKYWWILLFFGIGLVPASLGLDVPHSNRAILALPWLQLLCGLAIFVFVEKVKVAPLKVLFLLLIVGSFHLVIYLQTYMRVYTSSVALKEMGYGYDDVMKFVRPKEGEVERVYFTNTYGQAYIYILFNKKLTPMEYQHGGLANYTISSNPWKDSEGKKNVLVIGTKDEIPDDARILKEVAFPDGQIAFRIAQR